VVGHQQGWGWGDFGESFQCSVFRKRVVSRWSEPLLLARVLLIIFHFCGYFLCGALDSSLRASDKGGLQEITNPLMVAGLFWAGSPGPHDCVQSRPTGAGAGFLRRGARTTDCRGVGWRRFLPSDMGRNGRGFRSGFLPAFIRRCVSHSPFAYEAAFFDVFTAKWRYTFARCVSSRRRPEVWGRSREAGVFDAGEIGAGKSIHRYSYSVKAFSGDFKNIFQNTSLG
jgi:hypothetical protein